MATLREIKRISEARYRERNREKIKERLRLWEEQNKEKRKAYFKEKHREYYLKNTDKIKHKVNEYRKNNIEKVNQMPSRQPEFLKEKRATNEEYRIKGNLRSRLNQSIRKGYAGSAVEDLGCSIAEFKLYIEKQFSDGMSWSNWTKDGWHLDHIIPLSAFDLNDREQFKKACHYTNLRPLWAVDNLRKGSTCVIE